MRKRVESRDEEDEYESGTDNDKGESEGIRTRILRRKQNQWQSEVKRALRKKTVGGGRGSWVLSLSWRRFRVALKGNPGILCQLLNYINWVSAAD